MQSGNRTPRPRQPGSASNRRTGDTSNEISPLGNLALWHGMVESLAELVYVCDTRGAVIYRNPALQAYAVEDTAGDAPGLPAGNQATVLMFRPDGTRLDLEDAPAQRTVRTGEAQTNVELILRLPDGAERLTVWYATPVRDATGVVIGAVGVGRDLTDEHALAQAREDWLAAAAHDLRSPVATVLGHVQIAMRTLRTHLAAREGSVAARSAADPQAPSSTAQPAGSHTIAPRSDEALFERLQRNLEVAEASTQELRRRMATLLDASAATAGRLILHYEPDGVDLTTLVRRAAEQQASIAAVGHTFQVATPEHPVVVPGDRERLRQLLENLLANAVKYSPGGGPIRVDLTLSSSLPQALSATPGGAQPARDHMTARQADATAGDAGQAATVKNSSHNWALVRVEDQGIGIPASDAPHIFERYRRATGRAARIRGAGLGLYTCRAIADAHGGFIGVERSAVVDDHAPDSEGALEQHRKGQVASAGKAAEWHGTTMLLALPYSAVESASQATNAGTASASLDPKGAV